MTSYPLIGKTYTHYKGGTYKVITLAKLSTDNSDVVVYQSLQFGSYHVRPLSEWFESIGGVKQVPRFCYAGY